MSLSCQETPEGKEATGMKSGDFIPLNPNQHINVFFLSPHSAFLTLASSIRLSYALPHLFTTIHTSISLLFLILSILLFKTTLIAKVLFEFLSICFSTFEGNHHLILYSFLKNVFLLFYLCDCVGPQLQHTGPSLHHVGSLVVALGFSGYSVGSRAHGLGICGVDFIAL